MTTATSAALPLQPPAYLANVAVALRDLVKAVFSVPSGAASTALQSRIEVLRMARECQHSAPSLSQELTAMACRD